MQGSVSMQQLLLFSGILAALRLLPCTAALQHRKLSADADVDLPRAASTADEQLGADREAEACAESVVQFTFTFFFPRVTLDTRTKPKFTDDLCLAVLGAFEQEAPRGGAPDTKCESETISDGGLRLEPGVAALVEADADGCVFSQAAQERLQERLPAAITRVLEQTLPDLSPMGTELVQMDTDRLVPPDMVKSTAVIVEEDGSRVTVTTLALDGSETVTIVAEKPDGGGGTATVQTSDGELMRVTVEPDGLATMMDAHGQVPGEEVETWRVNPLDSATWLPVSR